MVCFGNESSLINFIHFTIRFDIFKQIFFVGNLLMIFQVIMHKHNCHLNCPKLRIEDSFRLKFRDRSKNLMIVSLVTFNRDAFFSLFSIAGNFLYGLVIWKPSPNNIRFTFGVNQSNLDSFSQQLLDQSWIVSFFDKRLQLLVF